MQVPILMYHSLDDESSMISVQPELFARQMCWLYEHGYRAVRLGELVGYLGGGRTLPNRAVVITFDDGLESVYQIALPVLSRYGFSATAFVVPAYCGRTNAWPGQPPGVPCLPLMSWAHVCELDRAGIEVGAHTVHHGRLDRLGMEEATAEILDSKARIEDRLGHAVETFAYPYGRYNAAVKAVVRRAFTGASAAYPGLAGAGSDPWALPRIDAHYVARQQVFRRMGNRLFGPYLGLRRSSRTLASLLLRRQW